MLLLGSDESRTMETTWVLNSRCISSKSNPPICTTSYCKLAQIVEEYPTKGTKIHLSLPRQFFICDVQQQTTSYKTIFDIHVEGSVTGIRQQYSSGYLRVRIPIVTLPPICTIGWVLQISDSSTHQGIWGLIFQL